MRCPTPSFETDLVTYTTRYDMSIFSTFRCIAQFCRIFYFFFNRISETCLRTGQVEEIRTSGAGLGLVLSLGPCLLRLLQYAKSGVHHPGKANSTNPKEIRTRRDQMGPRSVSRQKHRYRSGARNRRRPTDCCCFLYLVYFFYCHPTMCRMSFNVD